MKAERPEVAGSNQPEICVCECGKEFTPYKKGCALIKKVCPDCQGRHRHYAASINKPKDEQHKAEASKELQAAGIVEKPGPPVALDGTPGSMPPEITIVFRGPDAEMFGRIEKLSARERRPMDMQILSWLENLLPELKAETEK